MAFLLRRKLLMPRNFDAGRWKSTHLALHLQSRNTSSLKQPSNPPEPLRRGGPYSKKEDKLMQKRRRQGATWKDIAAELGVSSIQSVAGRFYYVQEHADAKSNGGRWFVSRTAYMPWSVAEEETLKQHYQARTKIADIGRKMNRTKSSIRNALSRLFKKAPAFKMKRRMAHSQPDTLAEHA